MRKKTINIKDLCGLRYFSVTAVNVRVGQYTGVLASSNLKELPMQTRYLELIEKLKNHLLPDTDAENPSPQPFRNYMSSLNGFLTFCGKTQDSFVGSELDSNFDSRLADYLSAIEVAPRTLRDRAYQLRSIRDIYLTNKANPVTRARDTNLAAELRKRIAAIGVPPKTLAREIGINGNTMRNWLAGSQPRKATIPGLRRLEVRLGLERDTFVNLIDDRGVASSNASVPAFRVRLRERTEFATALKVEALPPELLSEWKNLYDYKTNSIPVLKRNQAGKWREIPQAMSLTVCSLARRGTMTCPTADHFSVVLRTYLGTISRILSEESPENAENLGQVSLAWCAHPVLLERYVRWMLENSDGVRHGSHKKFATSISALLRTQTGYLWQQPHVFRLRLPAELRPGTDEEWQTMCEKSYQFLRELAVSSNDKSRNPEEPIAHLLELDEPFKPVLSAIEAIQRDAARSLPGGIRQACHKRNALLLALLLSNPLRKRSLACLTWSPNGHGTLRGSVETGWRISLKPLQLKNGESKNARSYNVKVADWVKPLLDEYITEYRDILLQGRQSPYLFVTYGKVGIWHGLGQTVFRQTKKYVAGSPGIGPHAFRHLVATTWLRKNPGDFLTVAELLNDQLATVMENYAHLRRDDSFSRYEAQFANLST